MHFVVPVSGGVDEPPGTALSRRSQLLGPFQELARWQLRVDLAVPPLIGQLAVDIKLTAAVQDKIALLPVATAALLVVPHLVKHVVSIPIAAPAFLLQPAVSKHITRSRRIRELHAALERAARDHRILFTQPLAKQTGAVLYVCAGFDDVTDGRTVAPGSTDLLEQL